MPLLRAQKVKNCENWQLNYNREEKTKQKTKHRQAEWVCLRERERDREQSETTLWEIAMRAEFAWGLKSRREKERERETRTHLSDGQEKQVPAAFEQSPWAEQRARESEREWEGESEALAADDTRKLAANESSDSTVCESCKQNKDAKNLNGLHSAPMCPAHATSQEVRIHGAQNNVEC